jgi:predicted nucleic acid-binding protein
VSTIVSDSSAIIDIDKACLLPALIGLPYHFVIPDALYEEELIELTNYSKSDLPKLGFHIEGFNSDGVEQAFAYQSRFPRLTPQDCFALTLASIAENTILLTGDKNLRKAAQQESIEVHGVIWACQQIHRYETASTQQIYQSLRWLEDDPTVWLPKRPLRAFLDYLNTEI